MKRISALVTTLVGAALACNAPAPITPTPPPNPVYAASPPVVVTLPPSQQATSLPAEHGEFAARLIEQVSAENLMAHVEMLSAIHSRHVNSATISEAAVTIYEAFRAAGGHLTVAYDEFPLSFNGITTTQRNMVATLPGSDPAAGMILIGAHYDSRTADLYDAAGPAPGADDNATGTAALLEIARVLANETPDATVVLVAFSAEEVGLWGSRHYVEAAQQRGNDIRAMIALDIIGNASGVQGEGVIRAFADPDHAPSQQLARLIAQQADTYLTDFAVQVQPTIDRPGRYSDHVPFSDAGIPAVRLIEAIEDVSKQHSPHDGIEHISATYLRQAVQLALASVINLAWGLPAP